MVKQKINVKKKAKEYYRDRQTDRDKETDFTLVYSIIIRKNTVLPYNNTIYIYIYI